MGFVLVFGFGILDLVPTSLYAADYSQQGPFPIRTQNPVYLQTANLNPARAESLPQGFLELRIDQAYSNLYERETDFNSDINMDMELYRASLNASYGFLPGWEAGVEIPFLRFEGGFLDSLIQNFHDFFGFPNGGRDQIPNGVFNYRIQESGLDYQIVQQSLNIGDIALNVKRQFFEETPSVPAMAFRFGAKLPSGDSDKGMGDGLPGFGLGLALEKSYKRLHGYLNLDVLVDGGNELLVPLMASTYFDFSLAGEFSLSRRTSAVVQLAGGTKRLKGTGLETWDGVPMDLIVGAAGDWHLGHSNKTLFWQLAFSEDITSVGPAVDFTVWSSLGLRFPIHAQDLYKGDFLSAK